MQHLRSQNSVGSIRKKRLRFKVEFASCLRDRMFVAAHSLSAEQTEITKP